MEDLQEDKSLSKNRYQAVAVGVSAGGLDVLETLLRALPDDFRLPLIIVQHLHPQPDDFLVEHLGKLCRLPVREAEEKEAVEGGVVYLAPANYHLLIEADKTFSLSIEEKVNFSRPSIDVLFETAADVYGESLIGIVLTGANRDGAAGMARIKAKGGMAVVQDPKTAKYPCMPLAALEKVHADRLLSIDRIGRLLGELGKSPGNRTNRNGNENHGKNSACR